MHIDWSTLLLQTVNAVVLLWLLARFLFRPVAQIVAQRQHAAAALLADADAAKRAAEAERDAAQRESARLDGERAAAFERVGREADAHRADLIAAAQAQAGQLRARAAAEADAARAALMQEAEAQAARLAVEIAARLLARLPPQARVDGFIDGAVAAFASLPERVRSEAGTPADPLRVSTPRALTADERAQCQRALDALLQRPAQLVFAVDPALIAGVELASAHGVVRNHLRGDLDEIAAALADAADTHAHAV